MYGKMKLNFCRLCQCYTWIFIILYMHDQQLKFQYDTLSCTLLHPIQKSGTYYNCIWWIQYYIHIWNMYDQSRYFGHGSHFEGTGLIGKSWWSWNTLNLFLIQFSLYFVFILNENKINYDDLYIITPYKLIIKT